MMFGAAMIIGLALAGAFLLGLLWAVASYNGFVEARAECAEAFAQMLLRLQQRNALLPALVETARTHMRHEREILEKVSAAVQEASVIGETLGARPVSATGIHELQQTESRVSAAMGRLLAISEAYPELRASPNMVRISADLRSAEDQVSGARDAYNQKVHRDKGLRATLPQALLSKALGFGDAPFFEADREPESPPRPPKVGPMQA
jgi:LemA protein